MQILLKRARCWKKDVHRTAMATRRNVLRTTMAQEIILNVLSTTMATHQNAVSTAMATFARAGGSVGKTNL